MLVIQDIRSLRGFVQTQKNNGKTIGFVPTMGYLHVGHQQLMQLAKQHCDIVIVSIFINPLQFGPTEDLNNYPRNLDADIQLCESVGVSLIFTPQVNEIYPNGTPHVSVMINKLGDNLCGASRPGHFTGVCTVVTKLFNLVTPDLAFFGCKDIQQFRIIETMVEDLNFPIKIISCDTVRASDGLALSSRNSYLSATERIAALVVPNLLHYIVAQIEDGNYDVNSLIKSGKEFIKKCAMARLDYLQIVDYTHLQLLNKVQGTIVIATAIFIGKTRLIDNIIYTLGEKVC